MTLSNGFGPRLVILGESFTSHDPVCLILKSGLELEVLVEEIGPDNIVRGWKAEGVTGGEHFQLSRGGRLALKLKEVMGVVLPKAKMPARGKDRTGANE